VFRLDTTLFGRIPKELAENVDYRKKFHNWISKDSGAQKDFLDLCCIDPKIVFDLCLWTYDPRNDAGYKNLPFILRPKQEIVVDELTDAIYTGYDRAVDKSRDEGATEIICKLFFTLWLLEPQMTFLVGSRKEEFVDASTEISGDKIIGDHKCLFHKILYAYITMPFWMRCKYKKLHKHFYNLDNGSSIDGEATNENFSAGDRRKAVLVDEFGLIDNRIAKTIRQNLSDVTDCVIFNSTQGPSAGHPYSKLLVENKIKISTLGWEENPSKSRGLYRSPKWGIVELKDVSYYKRAYPFFKEKLEGDILDIKEFSSHLNPEGLQKFNEIGFVADGGESNNGGWRSIWYDIECKRRDPSDVARNLDRNPVLSGDGVFSPQIIHRINLKYIREPDCIGELLFDLDKRGIIEDVDFRKDYGRCRLNWWGELVDNHPTQLVNYIIACDISAGTGASNSVAGIYNVNTQEKVGTWVDPNTPPESFADAVMAIAKWVGGGTRPAYIIWEANGVGSTFGLRITEKYGYPFYYSDKKDSPGWRNTGGPTGSKYLLFDELRAALTESLKDEPTNKRLIIHDKETLNELKDYQYYSDGSIELSCVEEMSIGARSAHGDRVVCDGLFVKALKNQVSARVTELEHVGRYSYLDLKRRHRPLNNDRWEI
jgi:hypothetical protein